jgi:hypothetical protein
MPLTWVSDEHKAPILTSIYTNSLTWSGNGMGENQRSMKLASSLILNKLYDIYLHARHSDKFESHYFCSIFVHLIID